MMEEFERNACLKVAFDMARSGTFKNYLEVEQALSVSESGCWDESLTEPYIRARIDELCAHAQKDSAKIDPGHLQG